MGLLERKIEPDVDSLVDVIWNRKEPKRVHNIELFEDAEVKEAVGKKYGIDYDAGITDPIENARQEIEIQRFLGYDLFRIPLCRGMDWQGGALLADDTTELAGQGKSQRNWSDEHEGPIGSWEDFDKYKWPSVKDLDLSSLEWLEKNVPENMGVYDLTAHQLEMITILLGYERMCYLMFEEPDLVDAVSTKVGEIYDEWTRVLCDFSCIKVIWGSDDMGFRTGTLVSPDFLREKVFPWHKKCVDIAHEHNKPYILHACGQLEQVMDDLIGDVGIDSKHSYEDVIMPVTEAKKRYGSRISILGGIDIDFLCQNDEQAIRRRVRETLEVCMPGGGYCLGTGNSVANYIPVENYLVMLDEGRKFNL